MSEENHEGDATRAELVRWLVRIESTIDRVANDHECRLRRMERFMYVAIGLSIAGAASGIGSMLAMAGGP